MTAHAVFRRFYAVRSCGHKHKHASFGKALAHIRSIAARDGEDEAALLTPYMCRFCHTFHVGHIPNRGRHATG